MAKLFFFLDETGDHGLTYIDPNFPIFLLCGCLFLEEELQKTERLITNLKIKYFNTNDVILHSRDIRKCEGAFQILFNLTIKESFYKDLNYAINNINFTVISSAINKEEHIKRHGKLAIDPYNISFSFIMERLIYCTDKADEIIVIPEMRGKKEDNSFVSHFNSVMDSGTYYVTTSRFKERIKKLNFCKKRENLIGSQIADLAAYPIARYVLNPREPYQPFDLIKRKIYCNSSGNIEGYGLKIFP